MQKESLTLKYPWLRRINSVEDYLPPEYYSNLLQPYTFGGVTDLQLLECFLAGKSFSNALELGCGSGRASSAVVGIAPNTVYTFSDLSARMLASAESTLPQEASFIVSDAVEFMERATDTYDLVYTLWSFSHSTHQHFHKLGMKGAENYISTVITNFVEKCIEKNGSFFLVHFDSLSDEQRILMRQWKRAFKTFTNIDCQSPSKLVIDKTLLDLDNRGIIRLSVQHLQGDPIKYKSENVLLETFMNFHLETYFNSLPIVEEVLNDIKEQATPYRQSDGTYAITPGCYVYSFSKK